MTHPLGLCFLLKRQRSCFSKDVFFLSSDNSLVFFFFFLLFNIDSGVFFHCCQGRDTRGIGPSASHTLLFYGPDFKM